jgi:DEAD/DEAH box helicase domain-containing protein
MLPLQQAYEVKHSILEYLKATFSFKDRKVHEAFYRFVSDPHESIFKGPYVSLKLPFVSDEEAGDIPLDITPNFTPYHHQRLAFDRLTTQDGHTPQSTIITTGTSSGKTECFLYPILDYCYKNMHRRGIKVIILYPMNALATDQAKRLAETIYQDPKLKGKITAGLFIGEGRGKKKFPQSMGAAHIIENNQSIIDSPPDILLTNFKMLDYALMRSKNHNLWTFNFEDNTLLKFLVLDELHTYDGAQGTDVANLIRRLKLKLNIERGQICAVGTSATIGTGRDAAARLVQYAQKVYGEDFDVEGLITEKRILPVDFFESEDQLRDIIPEKIGLADARLQNDEQYDSYIKRQKVLWKIPENTDQTELAQRLKKIRLLRDIAAIAGAGICDLPTLIRKLSEINHSFNRLPECDAAQEINPQEEVIQSILALISEARSGTTRKFPFMFLQVQLWVRELSGVLREINEKPVFTWKDGVSQQREVQAMPAYFCRECGASGWLGVKDDNKNHFSGDTRQVYEYFFENHKNTYFINTPDNKHIEEYEPNDTLNTYIHKTSLKLNESADKDSFKIHAVRKLKETKTRHICPECNTENTMAIIGTRIATMSSVAVSQLLASDLDPRPDRNRKILAFTNSVQDAAHQAGFVESRNYRFTFRSSLQKVINHLNRPVTLSELQTAFIDYWKKHSDEGGEKHEEAYFYRFLPSDHKGKVDLRSDYKHRDEYTAEFKKEFDYRMSWEVAAEFGYNALIGRTLEKTGSSSVRFDEQRIESIHPKMKAWLEVNNLLTIDARSMEKFINGILHRMRVRGGIDHIYLRKFREGKQELREINWYQDSRHFLNRNFSLRSRLPKLITTQAHTKGMLDSSYSQAQSWFRNYFVKSFPMCPDYPQLINDFYVQLFETMTEEGLVNQKQGEGNITYAICPEVLWVEKHASQLECDSCGSPLFVAQTDGLSPGSRCLNYTCGEGFYQELTKLRPNYYQAVYNRNRSPRIYAAEHTGLLERKDRERKENDFKERPAFNSLNTIVATSTLEMGIDIGTLNSALNNSVPPLTSNYLQRVGRAGRSSGSALITNFAQSKPHDLYYYNEPLDMMEGEVNTPACFLEAREILFRHFFAFCLDKWASKDHTNNSIPMVIRSLKLLQSDLSAPDFFPNRIISFVKSSEKSLVEEFSAIYRRDIEDAAVLEMLEDYLASETFYLSLKKVFERLKSEYLYLHEKRKELDDIIRSKNLSDTDPEKAELNQEKRLLRGLQRMMEKRMLIEHLTNTGMLPNYAFPETGVTLNAWIKQYQAKGSNSIPQDHHFEIVRSASSALRELAPDNHFYGQGFKFFVSGLNTYDWKEEGVLQKMRFCSNCDHLAVAVQTDQQSCPKCGDASWSAMSNQHTFVKLNGVKSTNQREKAALDDSSDDRDESFYKISTHIDFDPQSARGAYAMIDIPFGIEYLKKAEIRVVNLGLSSSVNANKISINGIENVPTHGFVTCKHCGKSTSQPAKTEKDKYGGFHYGYCRHKDKKYAGKADEVFEEVYLFREIKTEAIKILLPVQDFEEEAHINMFKAGLDLGMKIYYQGLPQHIGIMDYKEFNHHTARFDRYLVLYDSISGGTGYLEKLFNPDEFTKVLRYAYQAISDCSCQHAGRDGCYRCIFTYSNQRIQSQLSRNHAEAIFKKIIKKSDSWENLGTGLGKLSASGQIEESELEDRFIRSLRNYFSRKADSSWRFEDVMEDGAVHYRCVIRTDDGYELFYNIRPQYELTRSRNVNYRTVADFFITLVSISKDGQRQEMDTISDFKSIAVYMDGYTYHASADNQRFKNDLLKRDAIAASGEIISWTLSWGDMERFDAGEEHAKADFVSYVPMYEATLQGFKKIPYWNRYHSELIQIKNSMQRLIWRLCHPFKKDEVDKKINLSLAIQHKKFMHPSCDEADLEKTLATIDVSNANEVASNKNNGMFYLFPDVYIDDDNFVRFITAIRLRDLNAVSKIKINNIEGDIDKEKWEAFWQVYNLVQEYTTLDDSEIKVKEIEQPTSDPYRCVENYHVSVQAIVRQLIDHGFTVEEEGGFTLEYKQTFAEAELGIKEAKIVIDPLSEEDRKAFEEMGYTVIEPDHFDIKTLKI